MKNKYKIFLTRCYIKYIKYLIKKFDIAVVEKIVKGNKELEKIFEYRQNDFETYRELIKSNKRALKAN